MSKIFNFAPKQLETANEIVEFYMNFLQGEPIDEGMLTALKIVLNWHGMIDCNGTIEGGLFDKPMQELLNARDDMPRWDEEY